VAVGGVVVLLTQAPALQDRTPDPFALFGGVVKLDPRDRRDLRAGRTVVRMLEESEHAFVGVFVAARIAVAADQFEARVRDSAALWRGDAVPATGTFGTPARLQDVASMALPRKDVDALRSCRAGACDVKLDQAEMARLRNHITPQSAAWRDAVQRDFRTIILGRVESYRRAGLRAMPPYQDHSAPGASPYESFSRLAAASASFNTHMPHLIGYLADYPRRPLPDGASDHLFWLETVETPRPTIQVLHVVVRRLPEGQPAEVLTVSRQVASTHYVNGSLAVTALLRDPSDPSIRYMAYLNRSEVDGLGGFFSGLKRFFVERRVKGAARAAFEHLRQRIAG
jgi:hypothetical protein